MYPVAYVSDKNSARIVVMTGSGTSRTRTLQLSHGFADFADFNFTQLIELCFALLELNCTRHSAE